MKRHIKVLLVLALVALTASAVYAIGPHFMGHGAGYGPENCPNYSNLTPEEQAKTEKFRTEAQGLRDQIHQKMTELRTLRTQTTPDWNAIEQKQKEIVELKVQIQKKAHEAGISGQCGCGGPGGMMGMKGGMRGGKMGMGKGF